MTSDGPVWLDEHEQRAWRAFIALRDRLTTSLHRQLQRDTGLSEADYGVLVQLSEASEDRLRHYELGAALGWEKSRLSHHLKRMAGRGLVEPQECPEDSRGGFVALTPAGRAAIEAASPVHVAQVRRCFVDRLTPEQLDVLIAIHDAVVPGLEDRLGEPQAGVQPAAGGRSASSR